jgi:hypothetical protein
MTVKGVSPYPWFSSVTLAAEAGFSFRFDQVVCISIELLGVDL